MTFFNNLYDNYQRVYHRANYCYVVQLPAGANDCCVVQLPAGAVAIFSLGGDEQFKAAVAKSRTSLGDTEQVRAFQRATEQVRTSERDTEQIRTS